MQNRVWIDLIRRVPAELHNQLILVTDSRAEIAVETLFRLEDDFVVFRGRLSGTTDGGMLFLLPYDRITAVIVARELKETDVQKMFQGCAEKETMHSSRQAKETEQDIELTPPKPSPLVDTPAPGNSVIVARTPTDSTIAARNSLLDKLRAARHVSTGR